MKSTKSLKRISFLAHSLGGLFARYAIAVLYSPNSNTYDSGQPGDSTNCMMENSQRTEFSRGTIAGLEPLNFITLASPHLGVRGKKQVCSGQINYGTIVFNTYRLISENVLFFLFFYRAIYYYYS